MRRQGDFLDYGADHLKPMMIKEVAEEVGVHPSTVSRAVANKYVHTPQGVFELRFFFSESVNGPEGGGTSLMIHAGPDDMKTDPAGNSGDRIACGVITK